MDIRRLTIADAAPYRSLRLLGLREHPEAFTSSWEEDDRKPLQESEARLSSSGQRHWGAFAGEELHGIAGLELLPRAKERHKARVVGMYVAPSKAGRGLGAALLDVLVTDARRLGLTDLVLTVSEGNAPALRLYAKAGFTSFGAEPRAICVSGRHVAKVHMHAQLT